MAEPKHTRLYFMGFDDETVARSVLEELKAGIGTDEIAVEDWALVHKAVGGKLTITTDKSKDPGAARGAAVGGAAGLVLAVLSGPIGVGAVLGGAAVGGVTAAIKDSGLKTGDIEQVSTFMADGRTGLMIAVPLAEAERFDAYRAGNVVFGTADRQHQVDIVPGRTFEQAIEEYRLHEED
jgi:uncharacterized membrane protein